MYPKKQDTKDCTKLALQLVNARKLGTIIKKSLDGLHGLLKFKLSEMTKLNCEKKPRTWIESQ